MILVFVVTATTAGSHCPELWWSDPSNELWSAPVVLSAGALSMRHRVEAMTAELPTTTCGQKR